MKYFAAQTSIKPIAPPPSDAFVGLKAVTKIDVTARLPVVIMILRRNCRMPHMCAPIPFFASGLLRTLLGFIWPARPLRFLLGEVEVYDTNRLLNCEYGGF